MSEIERVSPKGCVSMSLDKKGSIRMVEWTPGVPNKVVSAFLKRPAFEEKADLVARDVLADIRKRGDAAVLEYAAKFDGSALTARTMKVSQKEKLDARNQIDADFKHAVREAHTRIVRFAKAGLRKDWTISSPKGGVLGERFLPFDRIGAYIPGGAAPLASTALMTVTLAKVAGVLEIVACTPSDSNGDINPYLLFALDIAGATEVYKVGGIQSIGAMAYGTKTIKKVQKMVGPGGPYVTAAKRIVYGDVALDMVAGPSEIAVLADNSANPACVAADLLSQAEHGTGSEKSLLVTPSKPLAEAVREELLLQTETLSRQDAIRTVLAKGTLLVVVDKLDDGMELCNLFAAEHLELLVREPRRWVSKVRAAGAIFVGNWTPECAGDFVAGPDPVMCCLQAERPRCFPG